MTGLRNLLCALFLIFPVAAHTQDTRVAFGTSPQDTSAPVEVTSDELAVDQEKGEAVFTGNVVIIQGEMRMSAPRVVVIYGEQADGIEQLLASGGVTLVSGPDAAEAQNAEYNVDDGVIVMTGDVLMTQGPSTLSSDRMNVDLGNGTAQMSGRVRTIIGRSSD